MNDTELYQRNQIKKSQLKELGELLVNLAKFKTDRNLDSTTKAHIEEVQLVAMGQKRELAEAYIDPWQDIKDLIKRNAKHRKGFYLAEVEESFILDQAQAELTELKDDPNDAKELADILGCLMHYAQKKNWSWVWIESLLVEKLKERFDSPKDEK